MIRIPGFALSWACLLFVACGAPADSDAPATLDRGAATSVASPAAEVTAAAALPTSTPAPTPAPTVRVAAVAPPRQTVLRGVQPLEAGFPIAAALVGRSETRVGVAVLDPAGSRFTGGDDGAFALASVVKIPVMIATLERAQREARSLTTEERALLELMIEVSSNNATDALWRSLGQGAGIAALLEPLGVTGIEYARDNQWGDSRATPLAIAELLDRLVDEQSPLAAEVRAEALVLLRSVADDQRWGASAGVDLTRDSSATLAIKNGWYPEAAGWLLNSAGLITVEDARSSSAHIVVVLTEGAETHEDGIRLIEDIASAVNRAIVPPALVLNGLRSGSPEATPAPGARPTADAEPSDEAAAPEEKPPTKPESTPEATPPPVVEPPPAALALVRLGSADDVLVPTGGLVRSAHQDGELTLWYELGALTADELLAAYARSMGALGWSEVTGPPSVVLAKGSEERWVGLALYPLDDRSRLLRLTIAPAPAIRATAATGSP